jgi:hypothetical protein
MQTYTSDSLRQKTADVKALAVMSRKAARTKLAAPHRIELNLRDVNQLFNSMDPSPFHEKDLDHDAEEFIISWAQEFHRREPVELVIHLQRFPVGQEPRHLIEQAVHHYFAYRARLNAMEFKRLMKQGRTSLFVGVPFLAACLLISDLLTAHAAPGRWLSLATQSLTIAGWVAMWRPMQTYLYDWWPLRRRGQIFEKLSRMKVEVRTRE